MAIEDYSRVIDLEPGNTAVLYGWGLARMSLDRHERAIEDLNAIIRVDPDNVAAYTGMGFARTALGEHLGVV